MSYSELGRTATMMYENEWLATRKDESSQLAVLVSDKYRKDLASTECFMCQALCWAPKNINHCDRLLQLWPPPPWSPHTLTRFAHVTCVGLWHQQTWSKLGSICACTLRLCLLLLRGTLFLPWEQVWISLLIRGHKKIPTPGCGPRHVRPE